MLPRPLVASLYRGLLKYCRLLDKTAQPVILQTIPEVSEFQQLEINNVATTYEKIFSTYVADPSEYASFLGQHAGEPVVGPAMREVVRQEFRRRLLPEGAITAVDRAFKAMRELQTMHSFMGHCSISDLDGVRIILSTVHAPMLNVHRYYYRVRVENRGADAIKLYGRAWTFEGSNGFLLQVPKWSLGVIGKHPVLQPAEEFHYVSCADLPTDIGTMNGALRFQNTRTGEWIDMPIKAVKLWPFSP